MRDRQINAMVEENQLGIDYDDIIRCLMDKIHYLEEVWQETRDFLRDERQKHNDTRQDLAHERHYLADVIARHRHREGELRGQLIDFNATICALNSKIGELEADNHINCQTKIEFLKAFIGRLQDDHDVSLVELNEAWDTIRTLKERLGAARFVIRGMGIEYD